MATESLYVIKLELKYCENCGGLWIRREGDHGIYCRTCRQIHCRSENVNQQRRQLHIHTETRM